ncbi:MAG: tRNA glutamyl-Q(34) synthetase GluQRS, partial [Bacteroidetes bacterium]|nr:tRNA glutamyl-Q(34) synthetase GluQRS [Bacteroidota bacterium]
MPAGRLHTRYAPSPTGYLHLGHVLNALYTWGLAAKQGAEVLFRLEDHDRQRCRPEYAAAILEDLRWLGFLPAALTLADVWQQQAYWPCYTAQLQQLAA